MAKAKLIKRDSQHTMVSTKARLHAATSRLQGVLPQSADPKVDNQFYLLGKAPENGESGYQVHVDFLQTCSILNKASSIMCNLLHLLF